MVLVEILAKMEKSAKKVPAFALKQAHCAMASVLQPNLIGSIAVVAG